MAVLAVRPALPSVLSQTPAALHYPVVLLAAWVGGFWPGLLSTFACTIYSSIYLRPHLLSDPWQDLPGLIRSFMFLYTSVFFILLVSGLQRAWQRAEEAVNFRDEFLSLAAHELQTPLTGLLLQTQLRQRRAELAPEKLLSTPELIAMARSDLRQLQRLTRLVDNMLDISRMRSGQAPFHPVEADLCVLVSEFVARLREQKPEDASLVTLQLCEETIGRFDALQLEQILGNLVGNALKYGERKPVVVSVRKLAGGRAELLVKDQGPGVPREEQERIFRKFERLSSQSHVGGLGLGLHISRELAARHGGSLRVESEPGAGATFVVSLPLKNDA